MGMYALDSSLSDDVELTALQYPEILAKIRDEQAQARTQVAV